MNSKKRLFIPILFMGSVIFSCDEDDVSRQHVQWEKIEFINEGVVYAIYGDLSDYMLVSTLSKILRTSDGGKTWQEVKRVNDAIGGFHPLNDAIYAVSNSKDYVSHDHGNSWEEVTTDWDLNASSNEFNDSKGILYQVVRHSNGELALPTSLLRSVNKGNSWENIFPHRHIIYAWHIDTNDKVYIGVSGSRWDGEFFKDDTQFRAYLFYMK